MEAKDSGGKTPQLRVKAATPLSEFPGRATESQLSKKKNTIAR